MSSTVTVTKTATSGTPQLHTQETPLPQVDHLDRHGYLFGQKLTASMSPLLHDVVYKNIGLNWAQVRLDSTDMDLFLKLRQHPKFYGMLTPRSTLTNPLANTTQQALLSPCHTKSPS